MRASPSMESLTSALLKSPQSSSEKKSFKQTSTQTSETLAETPWKNYLVEFKEFWSLAWPVMITSFFEVSPGIVSIILVGNYCDKRDLSATALGTMFSNVTGMSLGLGLNSALGTLCSQAYGSRSTAASSAAASSNVQLLGIYFQRGLFLQSVLFFFVFFINWYTEDILVLLGQPPEISQQAGLFVRYLLISVPSMWVYDMCRKVVQSVGIVKPMMYISLVSNIINIFLTYIFLTNDLGYLSAAVSRSLANVSLVVMFFFYATFLSKSTANHVPDSETEADKQAGWSDLWPGWTMRALDWKGCLEYIYLGGAGIFALCSEWWAFEVLAILSGLVPNPEPSISANAILLNCSLMTFMFYLGISVATTVRVGNFLGAGEGEKAKVAAKVGIAFAVVFSTLAALFFIIFRTRIPYLFVKDETVAVLVKDSLIVLAAYQLVDSLNMIFSGVFKGAGEQRYIAYINLVSYYVIGIPFGTYLTFELDLEMDKVESLWWGLNLGLFSACSLEILLIRQWDWVRIAEKVSSKYEQQGYLLLGEEETEEKVKLSEQNENDSENTSGTLA